MKDIGKKNSWKHKLINKINPPQKNIANPEKNHKKINELKRKHVNGILQNSNASEDEALPGENFLNLFVLLPMLLPEPTRLLPGHVGSAK